MDREPFILPHAYTFRVRASASGQDYRIAVAEPIAPAPADGFPVIYLLDASGMFGTLVEAIRMRARRPDATGVGPAIVVGIMHDASTSPAHGGRIYDYTPGPTAAATPTPPGAAAPAENSRETPRRGGEATSPEPATAAPVTSAAAPAAGGAQAFLDFLERDLKPAIEARHPIDRRQQTLFGHSLGGYFTLWTLLSRRSSFSAFVAVSPSIWWNPGLLEDVARESARESARENSPTPGHVDTFASDVVDRKGGEDREDGRDDRALPAGHGRDDARIGDARRVMITIGEFEQRRAPWQPDGPFTDDAVRRRQERRMVDAARDMAEQLAAHTEFEVDFRCFDGEDHASVVILSVAHALRFVLPPASRLVRRRQRAR